MIFSLTCTTTKRNNKPRRRKTNSSPHQHRQPTRLKIFRQPMTDIPMHSNPKVEIDTETLKQQFTEAYKVQVDDADTGVFFSPGRVNLIGEYTDFTGGLVFPCAIDRGTKLIARRSHNHRYRFMSTNDSFVAELSHEDTQDRSQSQWVRYPTGVINQFHKLGMNVDGIDLLYSGNIPAGAGLSSSASIEVVTAFALNQLFDCKLDMLELIKLAQRAENEFVGTQCGIMDQFAVAMGQRDHALYLDCGSLEYQSVPMQLGKLTLVIADTGQVRENSESAYNDRVADCQQALDILKNNPEKNTAINQLAEVTPALLDQHRTLFANQPVVERRARHVANENARVRSAVTALAQSNFIEFGQLMDASHASLKSLFEVSSEPLDHMVRIARSQPGVLGSRLTGAGFGGCTINLLESDSLDGFVRSVGREYSKATSLVPEFYTFQPADGVRQLA